ncbi:MAG: hypothetical protein AB7G39_03530 [Alphaproteobacteria bacterium]
MTARLGALIVLLTLGAVVAFGLLALREGRSATRLAAAQNATVRAEGVYAAAAAAARERDLVYLALMQAPEQTGPIRPLIAGARTAGAFPSAVRAAVGSAVDFGPLDHATADLDAMRAEVDAAIGATRDPAATALADRWMAAATERVGQLIRMAGAIAAGAETGDPAQRARFAASFLAERFAFERAVLAGAAISGRPLPSSSRDALAVAIGGAAFAWQELAAAGIGGAFSDGTHAAVGRLDEQLTGVFEPLRRAMAAAALGDGSYPAGSELWLERSGAILDAILQAGAAIGRDMAERVATAGGGKRGNAAIYAALALVALVLGLMALSSRRPPGSPVALPAPVPSEPGA